MRRRPLLAEALLEQQLPPNFQGNFPLSGHRWSPSAVKKDLASVQPTQLSSPRQHLWPSKIACEDNQLIVWCSVPLVSFFFGVPLQPRQAIARVFHHCQLAVPAHAAALPRFQPSLLHIGPNHRPGWLSRPANCPQLRAQRKLRPILPETRTGEPSSSS
jgi:hypothetical protein